MRSRNEVMTPEAVGLNVEGPSNSAHWHKRATEAEAEVAQARQTAEYWKAEHLAGNARIGELHDELAATALRSADHLRKAIKAEAEIERLRLKCQEHRDGRLAALERVATLERTLQEVGDLAASSATGPAQLESLKMIESIPPPWLRFSMAAAPAPAR